MKVFLNLSLYLVIMDTLYSSLEISDGGAIFKYSAESRERVFRELEKSLKSVPVEITVGEENKQSPQEAK